MDIQQLQEIQKSYRSKKVLGEQAQKTLDACKRGMTDDAYAFSEGLTEYLERYQPIFDGYVAWCAKQR